MRRLAWFTAGFAAACLVCCYALTGWRLLLAASAVLALAALFPWLALRRQRGRGFAVFRRALALCLGAAAAAGWFGGWTALFRAPAQAMEGQTLELSGTAAAYPVGTSTGGWSLAVSLDGGFAAPDVLLYAGEGWDALRPGDRVRFTARLAAAGQIRGDETTYYTSKGIFLLGYCDGPPAAVERPARLPVRFWPARCAQALKESLYAAFPPDAAPLCAALVTGDKGGLSEGLSASLSRAGAAHAVVVSGMHVSCLVFIAMCLLRSRRLAFAAIPLLLFYALMTGGSPSALRAVVMQAVLLCAPLARQESDAPTALSFALLLLLLSNPCAAGSVSLQLSFTSVAGIIAASPRLAKPAMERIRALRKRHAGQRGWAALCSLPAALAGSLAAGFGAMLFSQPVLTLYFHRACLVFPVTNLLILWAVQLLLPAALAVGCLGLVLPELAHALGWLFGWLARYISAVAEVLGRWRFASVDTGNLCAMAAVFAAYLFLVMWLAGGERRPRPAVPLACLVPLFGAAFLFTRLPVEVSLLTVAALDVGQGSSTAFLSGGRTCLVDCGGNGPDNAGDIAADYFAALGIVNLDLLVLTHFDADHINGLPRLFDRMEVAAVAVPAGELAPEVPEELRALFEAEGARVEYVDSAARLELGDAALTLYPPLGGDGSNESGLFALCSAGGFDALVTGDAGTLAERLLIKSQPLPDIELLVAGHHGSSGSTSEQLLDALLPELALISSGWNSYGHPSPETLERLSSRGIQTFRTDRLGTVGVYVSQGAEGYAVQIDATEINFHGKLWGASVPHT